MKVRSIRFWRRIVQCSVALAFIVIPLLNKAEVNTLSGNFLSFNFAGIPLSDPLASLQVMTGVFSATPKMLIGFGIALVLAALMGMVFCSWICPFGFLSELVHGRKEAAADTNAVLPVRAGGFAGKACLVLVGLVAVALFVRFPFLNQLSMPGWYSRALQQAALYHEVLLGAVCLIPGILLLERLCRKRFWCRHICPQSVLIALSGLLVPKRFRVHFDRHSCTCKASERVCIQCCSLGLNPRGQTFGQRLQCNNCGDCVDACRLKGRALTFGFTPAKKTAPPDL